MTKAMFEQVSAEYIAEYIAERLGIRYCGKQLDVYFLYNDDHVTGGSFAVRPNDHCLDGVRGALESLRKTFSEAEQVNENKAV